MLQQDLIQNAKAIWVQIYLDRMQLMQQDGAVLSIQVAQIPYSHSRMILADFESASMTLSSLMRNGLHRIFSQTSTAYVQIMEPGLGDITPIEKRAFKELFDTIGMSQVRLYDVQGNSLNVEPHVLARKKAVPGKILFVLFLILLVCTLTVLLFTYV